MSNHIRDFKEDYRAHQIEQIEREKRELKKMMRAGLMAAYAGGSSLAFWILQRLFGGITGSEKTDILADQVCVTLMVYAATIFLVFLFRRKLLLKVHLIMTYMVVPGIILKLLMDYAA